MLNLDTLTQLKQLKQEIKDSRNLMEGTVKGTPNKFGFVSLDSGKDVYLPAEEMEKVLPGDRIEVEIIKDSKNKKVAKIERLISSPTEYFCGKYITKGKTHFVEPEIAGMNRWFFIPPQKRKNATNKDLVKCKISQHPYKTGNAQASVIEIIGQESDIGIEFNFACKKYDIRKNWSEKLEKELSTLTEDTIQTLANTRNDLCHLSFVTIDSPSTVDIDDAIYIKATNSGWKLSVAIADPSAIVPKNSDLEKEAIKRASSLYFPGQHISMFPEKISSDLCSLKEGVKRLAKVVEMDINQDGEVIDYKISESVIQSHKKFSYNELSQFYAGEASVPNELEAMLVALKAATDALAHSRQTKALVQAERKEFYIELDDQQKIADIKPKVTTLAHKIVEEAMVATNRSIANFLSKQDVSTIFVQHLGIRPDRLETIEKVLTESVPDYIPNSVSELDGFIKLNHSLSGTEEAIALKTLISRQLDKSNLASSPAPHFGMGLPCYTTFTSPLRKAQDYLVHRQISGLLNNKKEGIEESVLNNLSESTQAIRNAVNDAEQWLKCQFIAKKQDTFKASVLRVFSTGFQVKLLENGIDGFVSTKEMEGKYSFNQERMTITSKDINISLDQCVEVKLKQIDWPRKQIQFELITDASN